MSNVKPVKKKSQPVQKSDKKMFIIVAALAILILGFVIVKAFSGGEAGTVTVSEDLKILKSEIGETLSIYGRQNQYGGFCGKSE